MSNLNDRYVSIALKHGVAANLTTDVKKTLVAAEPVWTTDDGQLYVADGSGNATLVTSKVFTVGTLPTAGTQGRRAMVTNANATTFGTIVAAGGTNIVPVYDDGTNWRIG